MDRPLQIRACLEHLRKEVLPKVPSLEVVVVDSSTNDASKKMCAFFDFVRYYYSKPVGSCRAHTSAFYLCEGKYSFYMGDDDKIRVSGLLAALKYLDKNENCSAVFAPWYEIHDNKCVKNPHHKIDNVHLKQGDLEALMALNTDYLVCPESSVSRTHILHKCLMHSSIYKDGLWLKNLLMHGDVFYSKNVIYMQGHELSNADKRNNVNGLLSASQDNVKGFLHTNTRLQLILNYLNLLNPNPADDAVESYIFNLFKIEYSRFMTQVNRAFKLKHYNYLLPYYELRFLLNFISYIPGIKSLAIEHFKAEIFLECMLNKIIQYLNASNIKKISFLGASEGDIIEISKYFTTREINIDITNNDDENSEHTLFIVFSDILLSRMNYLHVINFDWCKKMLWPTDDENISVDKEPVYQ